MTTHTTLPFAGPEAIPDAMKSARRWLIWQAKPNGDKKPIKLPRRVSDHSVANVNDPAAWATVEAALAAHTNHNSAGLAFALAGNEDDGWFAGIDLDDVLDESDELFEPIAHLVNGLPTYIEVSPSGRGLKMFFACDGPWPDYSLPRSFYNIEAPEPGKTRAGRHVEIYPSGSNRYFTVTGQAYRPNDLMVVDQATFSQIADELIAISNRVDPRPDPEPTKTASSEPELFKGSAERQKTAENLVDALKFIDPQCGYEDWLAVGMGIKNFDAGSWGLSLFEQWSASSPNKKHTAGGASAKWRQISGSGGTHYSSIFAMASAAGWVNPGDGQSSYQEYDVSQSLMDSINRFFDGPSAEESKAIIESAVEGAKDMPPPEEADKLTDWQAVLAGVQVATSDQIGDLKTRLRDLTEALRTLDPTEPDNGESRVEVQVEIARVTEALRLYRDRVSTAVVLEEALVSQRLEGKTEGEQLALTTLSALTAKPEEYLIDGLFTCGSTAQILAPPKTGKTFLFTELALCAAVGAPFLGFDVPAPFSTVLFQLDQSRSMTARALNTSRMAQQVTALNEDNIHVYFEGALEPYGGEDEAAFEPLDRALMRARIDTRARDVKIVAFDSMSATSLVEAYDAKGANRFIKGTAERVRRVFGPEAVTLWLHHTKKSALTGRTPDDVDPNEATAGAGISAKMDTTMLLMPLEDDPSGAELAGVFSSRTGVIDPIKIKRVQSAPGSTNPLWSFTVAKELEETIETRSEESKRETDVDLRARALSDLLWRPDPEGPLVLKGSGYRGRDLLVGDEAQQSTQWGRRTAEEIKDPRSLSNVLATLAAKQVVNNLGITDPQEREEIEAKKVRQLRPQALNWVADLLRKRVLMFEMVTDKGKVSYDLVPFNAADYAKKRDKMIELVEGGGAAVKAMFRERRATEEAMSFDEFLDL